MNTWMVRFRGILMLSLAVTTPVFGQRQVSSDVSPNTMAPGTMARNAAEIFRRPVALDIHNVSVRTALAAIATSAHVRIVYGRILDAVSATVSLHATGIALGQALDQVLVHTGIGVTSWRDDIIVLGVAPSDVYSDGGVITGVIRHGATKRPLPGVLVSLDNSTQGVSTDASGTYRLSAISAGEHRVTVRLLGFTKQTQTVHVSNGTVVSADFLLVPSASVLDQVVVTGTVVPTQRKAVPNAMTVITAQDIEQRGITKIDQLLHGDVPGLFAPNFGSNNALDKTVTYSRGATSLSYTTGTGTAATSTFNTNPIKTYIDGVELADPSYLNQIDPQSIERIEILTGPQASTIYGSNAINGVMQIFTKRGVDARPQLTLNLISGVVQNNFSDAGTPHHEYSAQLNGTEGRLSYSGGSSWDYMGPWTPAKQTTRTGGFGGMRMTLGSLTVDANMRLGVTTNRARGTFNQADANKGTTGQYAASFLEAAHAPPTQSDLHGQTLGLTLTETFTSWWSQTATIGRDVSDVTTLVTAPGYTRGRTNDSLVSWNQLHQDRTSVSYNTTLRLPVTSMTALLVTAGADAWHTILNSTSAQSTVLTGTLTTPSSIYRLPAHNTGGFVQTQLGAYDRLFLTYGLRAEWNPNYGAQAVPNYAPRYGLAYTQDIGPFAAKFRASYGRSTRPPQRDQKRSMSVIEYYNSIGQGFLASGAVSAYGNFAMQLANPNLDPEFQQGGEGGLELYYGSRGSLVITRYNQTVDGLIANITPVDSVASLQPDPFGLCTSSPSLCTNGYAHQPQSEYLNVGSIRNQGWELQGTVNLGPWVTKGTYTWAKSRVLGVTEKYRALTIPGGGLYTSGASFNFSAEHTWAFNVAYARSATTISVNISGVGTTYVGRDELYNTIFTPRLYNNRPRVDLPSTYFSKNPGYATVDMNAARQITSSIAGLLQVQNLANSYENDFSASTATLGRQTKVGLRVRW